MALILLLMMLVTVLSPWPTGCAAFHVSSSIWRQKSSAQLANGLSKPIHQQDLTGIQKADDSDVNGVIETASPVHTNDVRIAPSIEEIRQLPYILQQSPSSLHQHRYLMTARKLPVINSALLNGFRRRRILTRADIRRIHDVELRPKGIDARTTALNTAIKMSAVGNHFGSRNTDTSKNHQTKRKPMRSNASGAAVKAVRLTLLTRPNKFVANAAVDKRGDGCCSGDIFCASC